MLGELDGVGESSGFRQACLVGQPSLEVFCSGGFLALVAHFILLMNGSLYMQFLVSFGGIGLLCGVAYAKDWSAKLEKKPPHFAGDGVTPRHKMGPSILTRAPRDEAAT